MGGKRYRLSPGTQVRNESFGLLFYTMAGPRLYFLSSGELLEEGFFRGELSLGESMDGASTGEAMTPGRIRSLENQLDVLVEKGVIVEC